MNSKKLPEILRQTYSIPNDVFFSSTGDYLTIIKMSDDENYFKVHGKLAQLFPKINNLAPMSEIYQQSFGAIDHDIEKLLSDFIELMLSKELIKK